MYDRTKAWLREGYRTAQDLTDSAHGSALSAAHRALTDLSTTLENEAIATDRLIFER